MTTSIDKPRSFDQLPIDDWVQRLLDALQLPVKIAKQTVDSIWLLCAINAASALWLAFVAWQVANVPIVLGIIIALVVGAPAWGLAKFYLTLREIIGLPDNIIEFFQSAKAKAGQLKAAHHTLTQPRPQQKQLKFKDALSVAKSTQVLLSLGKRMRDWVFLAKRLREVKALLSEVEGLASLTAGAMLLTNPLFMATVMLSVVFTTLWTVVAVVTALFYLF